MTTTIDLYFRRIVEAGGDDKSRKVGTVDLDDLKSGGNLVDLIYDWDGLEGDLSYNVSGQFTEHGFEVVFVPGSVS